MHPVAGLGEVSDAPIVAQRYTLLGETAVEKAILLAPDQQRRHRDPRAMAPGNAAERGTIPIDHRGEGRLLRPRLDVEPLVFSIHGAIRPVPMNELPQDREIAATEE